ncbi:hypothetical protein CNEO3_360021 [Clostridium neonatale]|nr:hypothetical protein CNEO_630028 [Clostridium neonatale]CAI3547216.1 hypothetical protein CNEO3_110098 [Clostridium neonatale]CAI3555578.1 hypothetical protein CNEO3_110096 [Clostridium neonatale]CAI3563553.1 hypothetical protein CNEO3_110099 [Clostridium neonatale]CAI3629585.1 hypothetical protein CNEO3_470008 [Clostridium neonatale]
MRADINSNTDSVFFMNYILQGLLKRKVRIMPIKSATFLVASNILQR